jgi:hypothetical protein
MRTPLVICIAVAIMLAAVTVLMELARHLHAPPELREGTEEKTETAYLHVRLGKIPDIKPGPRPEVTEEKAKQIKGLIAKLAEIKNPDFGMSSTLSGHAFAPIAGSVRLGAGLLTDHRLETSDAFRSLVALGPEALPFLLEALEDKTPTQMPLRGGGMWTYVCELEGNLLNPSELQALSKARDVDWTSLGSDDPRISAGHMRVGDVCFVAIGQIVGRPYSALHYVPSLMVAYNSPVDVKPLRDRVRDIWNSDDPTKRLLDSLLLDYATEDTFFNGHSLDGWGEGGAYQVEAALRLLYYFPQESAPLIAARLQALDVKAADGNKWMKREVKNRVRTDDFVKAVSWCKEPAIQKALADIRKRTDDEAIKKLLPEGEK